MNDTLTLPYYRPRVEIERADFKIEIGDYCFLFCSKHIRSVGAIQYRHLLVVLDSESNDVLYVTAETNEREGESVVYLGQFTPRHHATLTTSPALIHAEFFVPVACQVAREALELPYERYPLVPVEDNCIAAIPQVFRANYPQGVTTFNFNATSGVQEIEEVHRYLMTWLQEHILTSDMNYRRFVEEGLAT